MNKEKALKWYLIIFGVLHIITSFSVPLFFGDELLWTPRNLPDDLMIGSIYLAMGIVMLFAAKRPTASKLFIDFIILANIFHAIVMVVFAQTIAHVIIDAGFIGMAGVLPLFFYPWGLKNFLIR